MSLARQAANDFAPFYERREADRWALADICAVVSYQSVGLQELVSELADQHGIQINLQTLKNYARVAEAFSEEHRHYQYKWSNYLAWSKWEEPVKAMEMALDNCYSPRQMDNLRKHNDPDFKQGKVCEGCGKPLTKAHRVCEECLNGK